jgi:hypothetical protein
VLDLARLPALGCASSARAQRSVAGARATLVAYVAAVIAGNGTAACSLLTPAMAAQLAKADHQSSCETVIQIAAVLLRSRPSEAAQLRSYASTVKVTLHGDAATVPNQDGGGRTTLTYTHRLWHLASS